jgi:hypothetical protein
MPNEKLYTAKQAAQAVLAKAADLLKSSKNTPWDQRPMHVGVHNADDHAVGGKSSAGIQVRSAKGNAGLKHITDKENAEAKGIHKEVLGALKAQSKPNLGKAEMEKCGEEMMEKSDMKAAPSTDKNAPSETNQSGPDGVQPTPNPASPNDKINGNPAPGAFPQNQVKYAAEGGTKGHIKLAKFVGAIEQKRKAKMAAPAAPAPMAPAAKAQVK